ncbi:hypothetical protein LLEC1_02394 [Akanthomyces lecanii]|uniref:Adenylosuccinate synthetase n=1 Tax=Cordyceps confragosa TaxID=2714763 RepID=A0A179I8Y9_CORDF|nr:hypothetical protein LLEC1_02394 [Akanthomyces lecanii]
MATIILGSQWGDEGKGKISDILCGEADLCGRAQGGHNAGQHASPIQSSKLQLAATPMDFLLMVDTQCEWSILRKLLTAQCSFHLLPSGLISQRCTNLIGSGVVFNVNAFFSELQALEDKGLKGVRERIFVSDRAQINLELHARVDGLEEAELGTRKVGTTGRGIGPSYSTKASRNGIRIHDIFNEARFEEKLRILAAGYKKRFGDLLEYDVEDELKKFKEWREKLAPYCVDAVTFMKAAQDDPSKKILIEGANALMLDVDYGTYPYVTSSNTGLGGAITGLALNPTKIKEVIGVVKAYTTRVGAGIFKTEDLGEAGTKLQEIGREWGVSTGRRRRCGWLDLAVLKYSCAVNHYTALNLTKLDILDTFPVIQVAVAYKDPETGDVIDYFPADLEYLEKCEVVYEEFKGWQTSITSVKKYEDLPKEAKEYIEYIERFLSVPIKWIGTGPNRDDMIYR